MDETTAALTKKAADKEQLLNEQHQLELSALKEELRTEHKQGMSSLDSEWKQRVTELEVRPFVSHSQVDSWADEARGCFAFTGGGQARPGSASGPAGCSRGTGGQDGGTV